MIHGPLVHCLRAPALSVKSIISARWKGRQYTERGMGGTPSLCVCYPISRRSFSRARFSSRETWTWLTERMRAHCCWVSPL